MSQRVRLGELLVDAHIITRAQLDEVLSRQTNDPRRLGILLVEAGLLTETEVTQILSQQLSVPWVSLYHVDFSRQLLNLVPQALAERYCVVPIFVRRVRGLGQTLYIAMDDPSDEAAIAAVAEYSGLAIRTMIAPPSEIRAAICAYYSSVSLRPVQAQDVRAPRLDEPGAVGSTGAVGQAPPATVRAPSSPVPDEECTDDAAQAPVVPAPAPDDVSPAGVEPVSAAPTTDMQPSGVVRPGETVPGVSPPPNTPAPAPSVADMTLNARHSIIPEPRRGAAHRMITVTLLDGTEIKLPARVTPGEEHDTLPGERLTAGDMVAALRAAVHGADASQILGDDLRWERLVAAMLSVLLRKHLVADWEFIDEYNKLGGE